MSRPFFPTKEPLGLRTLALVFTMSLAIDFAHYHLLRTITHSLAFFIPFLGVILWLLYRRKIVPKQHLLPLGVAATSHVLADSLFGGFAYALPFSLTEYSVFPWGGYLDLSVETLLALTMFIVLAITRDWRPIPADCHLPAKKRILPIVLFSLLLITSLTQVGMVLYLDFYRGANFYDGKVYHDGNMLWLSGVFLIIQVLFALQLAYQLASSSGARWRFQRLAAA